MPLFRFDFKIKKIVDRDKLNKTKIIQNIFFFSGVLVNLHHSPNAESIRDDNEANESDPSSIRQSDSNSIRKPDCGFINIDSVQQIVAAKWAVDVINNQSLPNELKIGQSMFSSRCF